MASTYFSESSKTPILGITTTGGGTREADHENAWEAPFGSYLAMPSAKHRVLATEGQLAKGLRAQTDVRPAGTARPAMLESRFVVWAASALTVILRERLQRVADIAR